MNVLIRRVFKGVSNMEKHFKIVLIILLILGFLFGYTIGNITTDTTHLEDKEPTAYELLERTR